MMIIDGTEGGGQVLRTSLALSALTATPFHMRGIRGARRKPGLLRQHLCAVRAAATVCGAKLIGDVLGSTEITFRPGAPQAGTYAFEVGSAGSAGLVLQTIWPILWSAQGASTVSVTGGTHNSAAPPAEFLQRAFVPALHAMGIGTTLHLDAYGFMPAGGGAYRLEVEGSATPEPVEWVHTSDVHYDVDVLLAHVARHVGQRERVTATQVLGIPLSNAKVHSVESRGPGNAVIVTAHMGATNQVHWALGARNVRAEKVATAAATAALAHASVPVCSHLADQLLLPIALAGGGAFRTLAPTEHTRLNARIIESFLGKRFDFLDRDDGTCVISV